MCGFACLFRFQGQVEITGGHRRLESLVVRQFREGMRMAQQIGVFTI